MRLECIWLLITILASITHMLGGTSQTDDQNVLHMERVPNAGIETVPDTEPAGVKKIPHRSHDGVKRVHVIYMNHLDVGYASFINNILNEYFHVYFPRAALLGSELRKKGYTETFIYTTHPWLVSLYMNCPPNLVLGGIKLWCPNKTEVVEFQSAVQKGYITWHAGPMNLQIENSLQWLIEAGLNMSKDLDHTFNITRQLRVLSQRDVPGMTQAVIPSLVKTGVAAVSVGVNNHTPPPAVPQLFRWAYNGQEILATWHPSGYPDNPGTDPASPGGLSRKDCVVMDEIPDVLCFAFRTDNSGPPANIQEILGYYEILRAEFPEADIRASTLENYFAMVQPIRSQLPLVTMEIGDTWMVGVPSDPRKNAEFRATARVLGKCIDMGYCQMTDTRVWNASRLLLKLVEHTWGLSWVGDTVNWRNDQFHNVSHLLRYRQGVRSWAEQRNFTYLAIDALADHPVATEVRREIIRLHPGMPDLTDYTVLPSGDVTCESKNGLKLVVGRDGSLIQLAYNGVQWVEPGMGQYMSKFMYISYNKTDFDRFGQDYNWVYNETTGFIKPNMTENAKPVSKEWSNIMTSAYSRKDSDRCDLWLHLQPSDKTAYQYYGAPQHVWLHYYEQPKSGSPSLDIEVLLVNKTSTRLPEALYLVFKPSTRGSHKWWFSKIGHKVDPLNVILNGSHYQHGIDDDGVYYIDKPGKGLQFTSPDVPLGCPITEKMTHPTSFPAPLKPITDALTGVAFNFYNNLWDTNYIMWYPYQPQDNDFKARFKIHFL